MVKYKENKFPTKMFYLRWHDCLNLLTPTDWYGMFQINLRHGLNHSIYLWLKGLNLLC